MFDDLLLQFIKNGTILVSYSRQPRCIVYRDNMAIARFEAMVSTLEDCSFMNLLNQK